MTESFSFKHGNETITIELDLKKGKGNKATGTITKKKKPEKGKESAFPFNGEAEIVIGVKEKGASTAVSTVKQTAGNKSGVITITCFYDKDNKNTKGVIQTGPSIEGGSYDVTAEEQDKAVAALKKVLG